VLRIPWYVAWPLLIAFGALALHFVAVGSVYSPVRHPEGFWSLQAQLGATDVWLDSTDRVRTHGWFVACPGSRRGTSSCTATPATREGCRAAACPEASWEQQATRRKSDVSAGLEQQHFRRF
jgi:hypothetical protein